MDGMTRATLWIAALVLGAYFATTFLNCALDPLASFAVRRSGQACHALAAAAFIRGRRLSRSSPTMARPPTEAALTLSA
jgi:hypothetical protein